MYFYLSKKLRNSHLIHPSPGGPSHKHIGQQQGHAAHNSKHLIKTTNVIRRKLARREICDSNRSQMLRMNVKYFELICSVRVFAAPGHRKPVPTGIDKPKVVIKTSESCVFSISNQNKNIAWDVPQENCERPFSKATLSNLSETFARNICVYIK